MRIHEYQAKQVLQQFGLEVPRGAVATTPPEAAAAAERLGGPVVVKAQVLAGGRGKAGGIKLAQSPDQARQAAADILANPIRGLTVTRVLIEPAVDIRAELYLGIVLDRSRRRSVVMASRTGGVDIEEVAARFPESLRSLKIDPLLGMVDFQTRQLAYGIGLEAPLVAQFTAILRGLYDAYVGTDATLVEINPLAVVGERLALLDAKMDLDDNSLYRQPEAAMLAGEEQMTEAQRTAREAGLSYVRLDGHIGCMVNGAGLAMATMDVIKLYGGQPANFLDIGGGAQAAKVEAALRIILADSRVKSVLINIFGGITRGDEVARGILAAVRAIDTQVPFVTRLVGTNAEEGGRILAAAKFETADTLSAAAQRAVAMAA